MSTFDPLAILAALERHRVAYVIVGDLAGVLHGSDLIAKTVEIAPSLAPTNVERLDRALDDLGVAEKHRGPLQEMNAQSPPISIPTKRGEMTLTATPDGTGGYQDLRRAAQREPLGQGLRAPVASAPDLIRTLSVEGQSPVLEQRLRRIIELERTLSPDL